MTTKHSGVAVSNKMLRAAQESYEESAHPSYGLTDADMRRAIKAALDHLPSSTRPHPAELTTPTQGDPNG